MTNTTNDIVLSVKDLQVTFHTKTGIGKAVDGVSFDLHRGEALGLVGESGCGKSITALSIVGLHPKPAAQITRGQIFLQGDDLVQMSQAKIRKIRGRKIAMVLQDPMTALNPVLKIFDQLSEPLRLHQNLNGEGLKKRVFKLLRLLKIAAPEDRIKSYPHQFSGGMRQRIVGAIALSCNPDVLIADEPTTSLDVTVEAAYTELLKELQQKMQLSILYITHDFSVIARMCDRVVVMYAGRIAETAPTMELLNNPAHPYSEALINAVPDVRDAAKRLVSIEGQPPSIYERPTACLFAPRCVHAMPVCTEKPPPVVKLSDMHTLNCWRYV